MKWVCVAVAPKASDPSSRSGSTASIAVTASEVIVGKIMIANNRITASSELPPAVLTPASDASPFTSDVITPAAKTP